MGSRICSMCNIDKQIKDFYIKFVESEVCNSRRVLESYYKNDKVSNQRRIYYEKIKEFYYRNKLLIDI